MSTNLSYQDKTMYIEDAIQQQKQQRNQVSPYLTEKDRERGFFPSCRTDRFDWQKNNAMVEINGNHIQKPNTHESEKSTEGRWNKLIMKTENEKVSRRSITPNSNTHKSSQRVLNPDLLGTPKFEGIKVFKSIANDNWQKRRQDGHEKAIEMKHQKNIDNYVPNELVIPNTNGREQRDFSRLGRTDFSNREQISQILADTSSLQYLDDTKSVNTRSLTPDRCLYQKTHLKSGLIPTEERHEMQRINRSKSKKFHGGQVKNLLVDNSSVVSGETQNCSEISYSEKISKKFTNKVQKRKNAEENKDFWNDMKQEDLWKEEIKMRGDGRYGQNCTKEYILAENPMFNREDFASTFTDLMSEKCYKANLRGINSNSQKDTKSNISANKREYSSKSPQPKRDCFSTISNKPPTSKSPIRNNSQLDYHSTSKSPVRNNRIVRSETQSNLSHFAKSQAQQAQCQYQLSKSPSCRGITYKELSKSPIQERDNLSKSPSRVSQNNILKGVYSTNSSNRSNNINQVIHHDRNQNQQPVRNLSKSPSQVSYQRAPLSQISSHSNKEHQKNFSRVGGEERDDVSQIKSVVSNLFKEKFNYQQQQSNKQRVDNDDNYSILSYSISQIGSNARASQSPFKKNVNKSNIFEKKENNAGIWFGDSQSTISHISNQSKSKVSALTQTQRIKVEDKENIQHIQTQKKQRQSSKSPHSNRSQISQLLQHM